MGGFSVRRLLPDAECQMVGPWIFFDHMGPTHFSSGHGVNVRPHPHIHLATVTYLFEGELFHRDSLGNAQAIYPGDINLMVAGRGITHSEREREAVRSQAHTLHGLQLWHALPEADEDIDPAFYHYSAQALPSFVEDGLRVRVMMGDAYGMVSPVKTFAETLYAEAYIDSEKSLLLPKEEALAVYLISGELRIENHTVLQHQMLILKGDTVKTLSALVPSHVVLIGGETLSERLMEWNFVSSQKMAIEQAKANWKARRFPIVPGDESEFIPLP